MSPVPALELALVVVRRNRDAVVLVDGRSGSGKTTFAAALAERVHAALLRMEDVYPGWDGLDAAARRLVADALLPRAHGASGRLSSWDWVADRPGAPRRVRPTGPLVVEGCGALSRAAARFADLRVLVELPEPERRTRALARDGEAYAPHWEHWARQERAFAARESPRRIADLLVDGRTFPAHVFSPRSTDPD